MRKLIDIAYELSNLWNYMNRKDLCEYYGVTDRTLSNYKKALNLPKNTSEELKQTKPVYIWVKNGSKYTKQSFKSWEHFSIWLKAQPRSVIIDTMEQKGNKYVTCTFSRKTPEAEKYEASLCL